MFVIHICSTLCYNSVQANNAGGTQEAKAVWAPLNSVCWLVGLFLLDFYGARAKIETRNKPSIL